VAPSDRTTQTEIQKVPSEYKRNPTFSVTVAQVAQSSCGVSILGDTKSTTARCPGPPALADPA